MNQRKKQNSIPKGKTVYFLGFIKNPLKKVTKNYLCKAIVIDSPSPYTKSPHKVRIVAVAYSNLHNEGTEQDARRLLNKEVLQQVDRLNTQLTAWMTPEQWWS